MPSGFSWVVTRIELNPGKAGFGQALLDSFANKYVLDWVLDEKTKSYYVFSLTVPVIWIIIATPKRV